MSRPPSRDPLHSNSIAGPTRIRAPLRPSPTRAMPVLPTPCALAIRSQTFSASVFPPDCGALNLDPANSLLVAVNLADGADQLNLYDLVNPANSPLLLASWTFPGASDNNFGLGAITFGGNRLYALDTNNGLL